MTLPYDIPWQVWHGMGCLAFEVKYLNTKYHLIYVRFLDTSENVAEFYQRAPSVDELRSPFPTYRWQPHPGPPSNRRNYPIRGGPYYGIVEVGEVVGVSPMIPTITTYTSANPLFMHATDMHRFTPRHHGKKETAFN